MRGSLKSNRLLSGFKRLADVNCSGNSIPLNGTSFDWVIGGAQLAN